MKKHLTFLLICFMVVLAIVSIGQAQEKITGPWLWMIAPTEAGRGGSASTDVDTLAKASGGSVTAADIAENGVEVGSECGNYVWTPGEISASGGNNVNDIVTEIGLGKGDINDHDSWAYIELNATAKKGVTARVGSDDCIVVWLNGEIVHRNAVDRGAGGFQDTFKVDLVDGINRLLVKVGEAGGGWSMFVGIDADYNIMDFETFGGNVVRPQNDKTVTQNQKLEVKINMSIFDLLHDFTSNLIFNPQILKAISVDYGPFLTHDGADPATCSTPVIDNVKGQITGITCRRNTEDGVTGTGILATINFEAISVGESTLIIEKASFSNPKGEAIEFTARDGEVTVYGPHGKITGKVTDSLGNPVSDVEVKVFLNGQPVGINGETGGSGNYRIDNITQAGRVTVKAIKAGEIPIKPVEVDVRIGEATENVDFMLIQPTSLHSVTDDRGFIRNWLLLGLIDWSEETTRLMSDQLSPKAKPDARFPIQETESKEIAPQDGDFGSGLAKDLRWQLHVDPQHDDYQRRDQSIRLNDVYRNREQGVAYAFTRVKAAEDIKVSMQTDHGRGITIWLNGDLVHMETDHVGWFPDRVDEVNNLELKKGWNSILLKTDGWEFSCRFVSKESVLSEGEPLTNLEISPQQGSSTLVDQPSGLTRGTFSLSLKKGLNMISLPVQPDNAMTAKTLANQINATLIIRLEPKQKKFIPYVPEYFEGSNFQIEGGMGVIVNLRESQEVTFSGTVWDNVGTAPEIPLVSSRNWAFMIVGYLDPSLLATASIVATNGEQRWLGRREDNRYVLGAVDQLHHPVVELGDRIEIAVDEGRLRHLVTAEDMANAYVRIDISPSLFLPEHTRLLQNYPNPFNPETWIPFELNQDSEVSLTIYDIAGRLVRRLDLGFQEASTYLRRDQAIYWDGRTQSGEQVASGTYFYTLGTDTSIFTQKMIILK